MCKTVCVTGASSQDSSFLIEQLLDDDYEVYGLLRRSSVPNTERIKHLLDSKKLHIDYGDITDAHSINEWVNKYKPDELYHIAAMSEVWTSFDQPSYTFNVNINGTLNVLQAVRFFSPNTKVLFCASSEMFGNNIDNDGLQRETTPFTPQSPYAISKLAGFNLCHLYRKCYGLFIACSIAFNHESERRGMGFVTRKISRYCANLAVNNVCFPLLIGNLNSARDFGYAAEFTKGMRLMLSQPKADDYILSTGTSWTIHQVLRESFLLIGQDYKNYIQVDKSLLRPSEVNYLRGDYSKAERILGWKPKVGMKELMAIMIENDIRLLKKKNDG